MNQLDLCRDIAEAAHEAIVRVVGVERAWPIMLAASGQREAIERSNAANKVAEPFE